MKVRLMTINEMLAKNIEFKSKDGQLWHKTIDSLYSESDQKNAKEGSKFVEVNENTSTLYYYPPNGQMWAKWACEVEYSEQEEPVIVIKDNPPTHVIALPRGWELRQDEDKLFAKHKEGEEFEVIAPRRVMSEAEIATALGYEFILAEDIPVDPRPTRSQAEIEAELGYKIIIDAVPF